MAERRTLAEELGLAVAPVQPTALAKELGLTPAIPGAALPSLVPAHPAAVAPGLPGLPPLQLPPGHVPAAVVPPTASDLTPLALRGPLPAAPVARPDQGPLEPTPESLDAERAALDATEASLSRELQALGRGKATLDQLAIAGSWPKRAAEDYGRLATDYNRRVRTHRAAVSDFNRNVQALNAQLGTPLVPAHAVPPSTPPKPLRKESEKLPLQKVPMLGVSGAAGLTGMEVSGAERGEAGVDARQRIFSLVTPEEMQKIQKAVALDPETIEILRKETEKGRPGRIPAYGMYGLPGVGIPISPVERGEAEVDAGVFARAALDSLNQWYSPAMLLLRGMGSLTGAATREQAALGQQAVQEARNAEALAKAAREVIAGVRPGGPPVAREFVAEANAASERAFAAAKGYEKTRKFVAAVQAANVAAGTGVTAQAAAEGLAEWEKSDKKTVPKALMAFGPAAAMAFLTALGAFGIPALTRERFPVEGRAAPQIKEFVVRPELPPGPPPPVVTAPTRGVVPPGGAEPKAVTPPAPEVAAAKVAAPEPAKVKPPAGVQGKVVAIQAGTNLPIVERRTPGRPNLEAMPTPELQETVTALANRKRLGQSLTPREEAILAAGGRILDAREAAGPVAPEAAAPKEANRPTRTDLLPSGWRMEVDKTRTKEGHIYEAEVDWRGKRLVFNSPKDMENPNVVNHEIAHVVIETLPEGSRSALLDEYVKLKSTEWKANGYEPEWITKNHFHREEIAMDYGNYLTDPKSVKAELGKLFERYLGKSEMVPPPRPAIAAPAAPKPTTPAAATKPPAEPGLVQGRGIRQIVEGAGGKYKGIQEAVGDAPALVLFNEPSIGSTLAVPLEGVTEARVKERLAEFARQQATPLAARPGGETVTVPSEKAAPALPPRTLDTLSDIIALGSPSGRISGRALKTAQERVRVALFGKEGLAAPKAEQRPEAETLRGQATELRELAARGMKPQAYVREAQKLEARAAELSKVVPPVAEVGKPAGWTGTVDFSSDPAWHDVFYGTPSPNRVSKLGEFLRQDPNRFVTLYHGTDASLPIMSKGLLPTSANRAKSLQSSHGYVSLSVFPDMARTFGKMAYPGREIAVYAVNVTTRRLLPDLDQLRNKRYWAKEETKNTLADSLAIGHGARVRGSIPPLQLSPLDRQGSELVAPAKRTEVGKPQPGGKEPWQLTREEIVPARVAAQQTIHPEVTEAEAVRTAQQFHRGTVEKALGNKWPVPAEVLRDYPDLAVKYAKPSVPPKELQPIGVGAEPEKRHPATPEARETTAAPALVTPPREPGPSIIGKGSELITPSGKHRTHYKIVEADDLIVSHDPMTFAPNPEYPALVQERRYDLSKDAQQRVIEQAQNYDPSFTVNTNPDAVNGPPIVTPNGTVLGGNSRVMSTQRIYRAGTGTPYRDRIIQSAEVFGLKPDEIAKFKEPVLVRVLDRAPREAEQVRRVAQDLNRSFTGALGINERAVSAGRSITQGTLETLDAWMQEMGPEASIRDVLRDHPKQILAALETDGVITDRERPQFTDPSTGGLSEAGKNFVERALLGSVIDDVSLLENAPKSVMNKVEAALSDLARLKAREDEWDISPLVRESLRDYARIASTGGKVGDYLSQRPMFGPAREPAVDAMTRFLEGKRAEVKKGFRQFAQDSQSDVRGQGTLGLVAPPEPVQSFNDAFRGTLSPEEYLNGISRIAEQEGRRGGAEIAPTTGVTEPQPSRGREIGAAEPTTAPTVRPTTPEVPPVAKRTLHPSVRKPGPGAMTAGATGKGGEPAFAAERPVLPLKHPAVAPETEVHRTKLLNRVLEVLNVPGRVGRFRGGAFGIFKVKPEVIRTRIAHDVPVMAHELGHALHKLWWGTTPKGRLLAAPLRRFVGELKGIATKGVKGTEGFAEFLRLYLAEPETAQASAPKFTEFFEAKLGEPANGPVKTAILEARENIRKYTELPARSRILDHISQEEPPTPAGRGERFYTRWIDKFRPIQRVEEILRGKGGGVEAETSGYELARLFAGWWGKAQHFLEYGTFNPKTFEVTGPSLKAILDPVADRTDDLRVYMVAKRALEKAEQKVPTGIDLEDAKAEIARIDREEPEIVKAHKDLKAYSDALLAYLVEREFITEEDRATIRKMNEEYAPFYRVFEEPGPGRVGPGTGKTFADLWSPVKRMKGSERQIIDPLESLVKNTYTFINLAERNKVGLTLAREAAKAEGAGQWIEEIPAPLQVTQFELDRIKKALGEAGLDLSDVDLSTVARVFSPVGVPPHGKNILFVRDRGKRRFFQVDPDLYAAMEGLNEEAMNVLVRLLAKPASLLRLGATGLSPEFVIRNPIRDALTAFVQSPHGFTPGVDTIRGLFHALGRDGLYQEWLRAGGQHAAMVSLDRKRIRQELGDLLTSTLGNAVRHPIEALRMLSEWTEAATRLGEYGLARKAGEPPEKAALASREVSIDFARRGAAGQAINAIVAFWNAAVEGMDKFARVHRQNPKGTFIKALLGFTLPTILLYLLNHDDKEYQEMPRWLKDFAWLIPTRGTRLHKATPFIPIPKPFLWGWVYASIPERVMEWIDRRDPSAFRGLLASFQSAALPGLIPTAAVPLIDMWANRSSFTGRRIVPQGLERVQAEYQTTPSTSLFSRKAALVLARTGIHVSPAQLDTAIFGYTGGLGRGLTKAADVGIRAVAGGPPAPAVTAGEVPFVRAFTVRPPGFQSESVTELYRRLDELEESWATANLALKGTKVPTKVVGEALGSHDELLRLRAAAKLLRELRQSYQAIEGAPNMSGERKRQAMGEIEERVVAVARAAVRRPGVQIPRFLRSVPTTQAATRP